MRHSSLSASEEGALTRILPLPHTMKRVPFGWNAAVGMPHENDGERDDGAASHAPLVKGASSGAECMKLLGGK
mgnify:FL=1